MEKLRSELDEMSKIFKVIKKNEKELCDRMADGNKILLGYFWLDKVITSLISKILLVMFSPILLPTIIYYVLSRVD